MINTSLLASSYRFKAMGSPCEIRLFAMNSTTAENAISAAVQEIQRLEAKYSIYRDDNILHKVNQAASRAGSIEVDDEFVSLLNYANTCFKQSDGLFDITSGTLKKAWSQSEKQIPPPELLEKLLRQVGWEKVTIKENTIAFQNSGMKLDLGGIVKEYAADRAAAICKEYGIQHGIVDLGGDLHAIGPIPDGSPWVINIRHPRDQSKTLTSIELFSGGLASSGDYERCLIIENERYCHIISPKNGWPVQGLAAVTVKADQCLVAGSVSTIAMLKEFSGQQWLEDSGLAHVWMDIQGNTGGNLLKNSAQHPS